MCHYMGNKCRLLSMLFLTSSFFLVEIIVGYMTNSMALVADSFHMLSDVIALIIAFLSVKMSPKRWSKNTFGWARAEVLGALVNAVFLVALCFSIFVEALNRFYKREGIHKPDLILYVGISGLVVNVIGLFLFHGHGHGHSHDHDHDHGHSHDNHINTQECESEQTLPHAEEGMSVEAVNGDKNLSEKEIQFTSNETKKVKIASSSQLNMRGVFLHVLADALGSVIVIISALIIWLTNWEYSDYVDPALSIVMVCLITRSTWPLLKESAMILLQTVPTHIKVDTLQHKLLTKIDGILAVHEFHVWQLAGERIIASAHIRCHNLSDYMQIAGKVKEFFHREGIHSTTIQPEFADLTSEMNNTHMCVLDCQTSGACYPQQCCPQDKMISTSSLNLNSNNSGGNTPVANGHISISMNVLDPKNIRKV